MSTTRKQHGIKRALDAAYKRVSAEVSGSANRGGRFAGGLSAEGYAGGYRDALMDVRLALNGVKPSTRNYWEDAKNLR